MGEYAICIIGLGGWTPLFLSLFHFVLPIFLTSLPLFPSIQPTHAPPNSHPLLTHPCGLFHSVLCFFPRVGTDCYSTPFFIHIPAFTRVPKGLLYHSTRFLLNGFFPASVRLPVSLPPIHLPSACLHCLCSYAYLTHSVLSRLTQSFIL